jgi:type II secretory ATPase GspE/PulE/Tfp pilus assembly ATPase PilB-like protein
LTCLEQAVAEQSTEVHFEPTTAGAVRVRYRVGGQLREGSAVDLTLDQAMRDLKALAHLDLQDRVLQQGGFPRTLAGQSYEFTVALLPTVRGETAIVRVLPHHRPVDLLALGFDEPAQVRLKGVMQHPAGVLLLAGPADSGQMATAYALLDVVDAHRCKVVTVERRVRYAVDLFTQIEWLPQDFPLDRAFVSAAYQSADVLLVDGVEHLSNVPQVFEAAQQGALVMGTLALPDFQAVGEWLVQNQIKPQTLRQLLVAVVVLRLRGRPCPACHLTPQKEHGVGCEQCQFTGWIERRLNYETLFFDEDEARQQLEAVLADF